MFKLIDIDVVLKIGGKTMPHRWCICNDGSYDPADWDRSAVDNGDWYPDDPPTDPSKG